MALVFNGESIGVTDTGTDVTVPDHPQARLMYYLNCMYTVLILTKPNTTLQDSLTMALTIYCRTKKLRTCSN
jgi:hypothetical protein